MGETDFEQVIFVFYLNIERRPEGAMKNFDVDWQSTNVVVAPAGGVAKKSLYRIVGKRIFDLGLVFLSAPLWAPLIAILWLIARRDGGAGFYGQERVGLNGQKFTCWKLRTMVPHAETVLDEMLAKNPDLAREWQLHQKLQNDPRITRIGAFLRATSLDELPQIWNVLRGDMSLVGPRPFMTDQTSLYTAAGGQAYFRLRPGITGLWQVGGRNATAFVDRIDYDDSYYMTVSFGLDIRLILRTFLVVLRSNGQ